jgi:hypothetical protein
MSLLATVALAFLIQQAPATPATPATPPTRDEKIQTVGQLARIWASYVDPKSPYKQMVSLGVVGLVQDLAGTHPTEPPATQKQKIDTVLQELKKKGIDVSGPVAGVLAEFERFQCASKQSEARGNLKALYVGQESYRAEFDTYDKDTKKIGFQAVGTRLRYRYEVVSASNSAFVARAIGIDEMAGDEWTITENNDLKNTRPLCSAE